MFSMLQIKTETIFEHIWLHCSILHWNNNNVHWNEICNNNVSIFFSSSKIGSHSNKKGANRNWKQVLCNSLIGTIFGALYCHTLNSFDAYPFLAKPYLSTFYLGGFLAFYACATGDTWSSEIGIMSSSPPRLITEPWRIVPKGTNGGVTLLGLCACILGGLFIGITFWFSTCMTIEQVQNQYGENDIQLNINGLIESETSQYWLIIVATFCGLFGSLLDSFLGATLQFSGVSMKHRGVIFENPNKSQSIKRISGRHILTNNDVNMISTLITAFLGGCMCVWLFC
eukprot:76300_1